LSDGPVRGIFLKFSKWGQVCVTIVFQRSPGAQIQWGVWAQSPENQPVKSADIRARANFHFIRHRGHTGVGRLDSTRNKKN